MPCSAASSASRGSAETKTKTINENEKPKRFDGVAGLPLNAVARVRSAFFDALEGAGRKETSRGTSCDRSGRKGITNLSAWRGWNDPRGAAALDQAAGGTLRPAAGASHRRDLRRSLRGGGPGTGQRPPGAGGAGGVGEVAGRGSAGAEERPARRSGAER